MKKPILAVGLAVLLIGGCSGPVPPTQSASPTPTSVASTPSATAPPPTATSSSPSSSVSAPATPSASPTLQPTAAPTSTAPTATACCPPSFGADELHIASHLDALAAIAEQNGGIRAGGTPGYDASADYVADQLAALGFQVRREPVEFTYFNEEAPVELDIGSESWTGSEWLHANLYSGEGEVTAVVETVGISNGAATQTAGCDASEWDGFNDGNIALVMTGGCLARDKIRQAQDHGALAMITMVSTWDDPNETLRPTLLDPTLIEIPAVVTGADPIDELLAAADARDEITLRVDVIEAPATDDNVFGELTGETDEVLMLGGHLDSVLDGPGVNDNGSGVATLLALAEAVAARPPALTVRFAFWAAEEYGTLGSIAYVDSLSAGDREALQAYLNLDMVASPNAGFYVYDDDSDPVSSDISDSIVAALSDFGISAGGIPSGGSDHIAFWRAGIPFGGVFSGIAPLAPAEADRYGGVAGAAADPCYHLSCDDRSNADVGTAALFGNAIAAVVEDLAY